MRDCEAYMEQISALLDGELGEYETDVLMAHLDVCPECRMFYDAFLSVSENIGSLAGRTSAGWSAKVMRAIENEAATRVGRRRRLRGFAALAACLALVLLAGAYLRPTLLTGLGGGSAPSARDSADSGAGAISESYAAPEPLPQPTEDQDFAFRDSMLENGLTGGGDDASPQNAAPAPADGESTEKIMIMGISVRPIDAGEATEFTNSLAGIQRAEFFWRAPPASDPAGTAPPENTDILRGPPYIAEGPDALLAFAAILEWADLPGEFDVSVPPDLIAELIPAEGELLKLSLWSFEGRLYCGVSGAELGLYIAAGTLEDLMLLIGG